MCSQHTSHDRGPRGRGGRTVVRLDTAALWERLALLGRSQNWLAGEMGVTPSYVSKLVNGSPDAIGTHPQTDAQGPRRERLSPAFQIGGY